MFSDSEMLSMYIAMQEEIKPTLSIEVGAFDADYSQAMHKLGVECYAFEASPYVYNKHKDNLQHINYIHKAISDYDGVARFNIEIKNNADSVGHNGIKEGRWGKEESVEVSCTSLNSYFKDRKHERISLWIDCEGANKEVLTGANEILASVESILIETEDTSLWKDQWLHDDVVEYLATFGFDIIHQKPVYIKQKDVIFRKIKI